MGPCVFITRSHRASFTGDDTEAQAKEKDLPRPLSDDKLRLLALLGGTVIPHHLFKLTLSQKEQAARQGEIRKMVILTGRCHTEQSVL